MVVLFLLLKFKSNELTYRLDTGCANSFVEGGVATLPSDK